MTECEVLQDTIPQKDRTTKMSKLEKTRTFQTVDGKPLVLTTTRILTEDKLQWNITLRLKSSDKRFGKVLETRTFSKAMEWPTPLLVLLIEDEERSLLLKHGVDLASLQAEYSLVSEFPENNHQELWKR